MIGPFPGPAVQPASAVVQSPERHPRYFVAMFQELIRNCFLHRSSFLRLSNLPMREMMTNPIFHGNPYILKMRKPAALHDRRLFKEFPPGMRTPPAPRITRLRTSDPLRGYTTASGHAICAQQNSRITGGRCHNRAVMDE
jgi:hypothetical protein